MEMKGTPKQIEYANDIIDKMLEIADVKADMRQKLKEMMIAKQPKAANYIAIWTVGGASKYNQVQMQIELKNIARGE